MYVSLNYVRKIIDGNKSDPRYFHSAAENQQALDFYANDRYLDVMVSQHGDSYEIVGHIKDENSYKNEIDEIKIRASQDGKKFSAYCNCWSFNFSHRCWHIGAMLLLCNDLDFEHLPIDYQKQRRQLKEKRPEMIAFLKQQAEEEISRGSMNELLRDAKEVNSNTFNLQPAAEIVKQLCVCLEQNEEHWEIKFRVGAEKKYVVRSIDEFLTAVDRGLSVNYGSSSLTFANRMEGFDQQSVQIIGLMRYLPLSRYHTRTVSSVCAVDDGDIDAVFDNCSHLDSQHRDFDCKTISLPVHITAAKRDDGAVVLSMESAQTIVGAKGLYYLNCGPRNNRWLYCNQDVKSPIALKMYKALDDEKTLIIVPEKISQFVRQIYQNVRNEFVWDGFDFEGLSKTEEELTLYGDVNTNDDLFFTLECKYADGSKLSGFDPANRKTSTLCAGIVEAFVRYGAVIDETGQFALMASDKEETVDFVNKILPQINAKITVMVSSAIQNIGGTAGKKEFHFSIGVKVAEGLFTMDISSQEIPGDELAAVIRDYRLKRRFHRLKNGQILSLESADLKDLDEMLNEQGVELAQLKKDEIVLNPYRALGMQSEDNIEVKWSDEYQSFLHSLTDVNPTSLTLSDYFKATLRDYQKFGVEWMAQLGRLNLSGILADDMGLGKTLEVLTLIKTEGRKPCLVVCPSSLILNWRDEIEKFCPDLKAVCIMGAAESRQYLIGLYAEYDIMITSYDYMRRDVDEYEKIAFDTVILDEAQYIKNPQTQNARCVKQLQAKHKLALTGTPIENNLSELWSIFDFLMPGYLHSYNYFRKKFEEDIVNGNDEKATQRLKKMVEPFILRRTKTQVLTELPEKQETALALEFSDLEKKLYLANLAQVNEEIARQLNMPKQDKLMVLAQLTRLRQFCVEPRLVYDNIEQTGSKLNGCMELLSSLIASGKKVLLFSCFTGALGLIERECIKNNYSYLLMTGATSKQERHRMVEQFQSGQIDVFLISLKTGGTGLNLTAAEAVIHYDPWWNLAAQNQATDRAYRIGQTNKVMVYKMVMKDSIEEKILELQKKKGDLADLFVEGNEGSLMKMNLADLTELLKM